MTSSLLTMVHTQALSIIKEYEGLRLNAYICPSGVWTIGYGCTTIGNRPVEKGDILFSDEEAEDLLVHQLEKDYIPKLIKVPYWGEMSASQQSALISFAWNLGANFYGSVGFETISKYLREKQWDKMPEAFALYVKGGGKTLPGLVARRKAEAKLWASSGSSSSYNGTPLNSLSSNELKEIQGYLSKLDYYDIEIDGIFGKHTATAFAEWKTDNYLADTDRIGESSYQLLKKQASEVVGEPNWNDFDCKVSKYFTVGEVCQWDKQRIPTSASIKKNILTLAKELDKIRETWGSAIVVTSWYRPPAVNAAVGGVSNSQHLNGSAADIAPQNGEGQRFEKWLDNEWDNALGYGQRSGRGFTHIDMRNKGRIRWNY